MLNLIFYITNYFVFAGLVEYYTFHRKLNESSMQFDCQSTVVDLLVLKLIIHEAAKEVDLEEFRHVFYNYVTINLGYGYELNRFDDQAELKALFLLVTVSLIDVEDNERSENVELILFFQDVVKDKDFENSLDALSALLFGTSEFTVSSIKTLYVFALG